MKNRTLVITIRPTKIEGIRSVTLACVVKGRRYLVVDPATKDVGFSLGRLYKELADEVNK